MRCTQADRRAGDRRRNNPPRLHDLPPDELEAPRPDQGQNCVASPDDSGEAVCVGGGGNDGGLVVFNVHGLLTIVQGFAAAHGSWLLA